jgi:peptidylprolyl isomerase
MAKAKSGDTVKVYYTGKLEDGTLFDSSSEGNPLVFEIGAGRVIAGFEQAVTGMAPGETRTEMIPAEQAYGPRREEMALVMARSRIPKGLELKIGQVLQVRGPEGEHTRVTVTAVSDSTVTLDANHPLAGKNLSFEIELLEIVKR